jgi:hypothetical protein
LCWFSSAVAGASEPPEPPALTTLSNRSMTYRVPEKPYVILKRAEIEAVVVDNRAVNDSVLPGHRAGYNGIASLKHTRRQENLFVPTVAGLNFEHIHDGTVQDRTILFEPRNAPMELRAIDPFTAELYQKPTPHYGLESCTRYHLLADGTIEMTVECIPRRPDFKNGYVGLFWASYIHQPESLDIHLKGHPAEGRRQPIGSVASRRPMERLPRTWLPVTVANSPTTPASRSPWSSTCRSTAMPSRGTTASATAWRWCSCSGRRTRCGSRNRLPAAAPAIRPGISRLSSRAMRWESVINW